MNVALGDHQVTDYQADVEARTIGACPFTGSAIYYWDTGPIRPGTTAGSTIGTEPPPYENVPNRLGEDPHGAPRVALAEQQLVSDFFDGAIQATDNCGGCPCYAGTFTGP